MPWVIAATLMLFGLFLLLFFYAGHRIIQALVLLTPWRRSRIRMGTALVFALLNLFPFVFLGAYIALGRSVVPAFGGESLLLDIVFVYPFWFCLVVTIQFALLLLLLDLLRIAAYPLYRTRRLTWKAWQARLSLAFLAAFIVYSAVVIVDDTWRIRVTTKDVVLPAGTDSLRGMRLVHISDVQGDGRTTGPMLRAFVEKVNALQPDIVFFTGDLVTSGTSYISSTAAILRQVDARYQKIAAVGDHDYFSNKAMVVAALTQNGWTVLEDSSVVLSLAEGTICIAGITETYLSRISPDRLRALLTQCNGSSFRVAIAHQPAEQLIWAAEAAGYDLFLSGHTHGGGIAFGIPGLYLFAPSRLESRFMTGFYPVGRLLVVVSNGLGLTLAPFRFHAPAEITVLNLDARPGG